jgi:hypothetical protein
LPRDRGVIGALSIPGPLGYFLSPLRR